MARFGTPIVIDKSRTEPMGFEPKKTLRRKKMKNNTLKGWISTVGLVTVMAFGVTFANGGIIVSDVSTGENPCSETKTKTDWGIIVSDLTGIIVSDFTGILVSDFTGILVSDKTGNSAVNCGIIVSD